MFKVCKIIFILLFFKCLKKNKSKITPFFFFVRLEILTSIQIPYLFIFFYSSAYRVNIRGKT